MKNPLYIYVLRAGDMLKIGVSKNVERRIKQLQTGNPHKIILEYKRERADARKLEQHLHRQFHKYRIHGEWFSDELELKNITSAMFGFIQYDWDDE